MVTSCRPSFFVSIFLMGEMMHLDAIRAAHLTCALELACIVSRSFAFQHIFGSRVMKTPDFVCSSQELIWKTKGFTNLEAIAAKTRTIPKFAIVN